MFTQQHLNEARAAYYKIISGQSVSVVIDQNGERIEFQRGNVVALEAYIRRIESELSAASGYGVHAPLRTYL